ncbi:MAG: cysteine hydrolase family protein [Bacteroidales bacterium]
MRKLSIVLSMLVLSMVVKATPDSTKVALLVIDIQNFYFAGGQSELVKPVPAAQNAAKLIDEFRAKGWPVVYVKHKSSIQDEINEIVKPMGGEWVFTKTEVNSFQGTLLRDYLVEQQVSKLVICGMQTHMCVEAAVRAGADYGYKITLVHDACATKDLKWGNVTIPAKMVHLSTLATLKNYADVVSTEEYLKSLE